MAIIGRLENQQFHLEKSVSCRIHSKLFHQISFSLEKNRVLCHQSSFYWSLFHQKKVSPVN